jgi:hypothetical protein
VRFSASSLCAARLRGDGVVVAFVIFNTFTILVTQRTAGPVSAPWAHQAQVDCGRCARSARRRRDRAVLGLAVGIGLGVGCRSSLPSAPNPQTTVLLGRTIVVSFGWACW